MWQTNTAVPAATVGHGRLATLLLKHMKKHVNTSNRRYNQHSGRCKPWQGGTQSNATNRAAFREQFVGCARE
jgi:hypothetical protein